MPENNMNKPVLKLNRFRIWLSDMAKVWEISSKLWYGFSKLRNTGPCVTVFGSARFVETDPFYRQAREVARVLGDHGYAIMTGGGPGIMEAANRGARDVGAHSIGCNIILPEEQEPNPYLDIMLHFDHFFVRKIMLVRYSTAFILMPGGFGTLDEMFETLTLIQTTKIRHFPVIAMGTEFWNKFLPCMKDTMLTYGTVGVKALETIHVTDDPHEALEIIGEHNHYLP